MLRIHLEIVHVDKLFRAKEARKAFSFPAVQQTLRVAGDVRNYYKSNVRRDTGKLGNSAKLQPHELQRTERLAYTDVVVSAKHALAVEYGTAPHPVSPRALAGWAQRKGLNPFAVANAIKQRGTVGVSKGSRGPKGTFTFRDAFKVNETSVPSMLDRTLTQAFKTLE